jgi:hypothetical protein
MGAYIHCPMSNNTPASIPPPDPHLSLNTPPSLPHPSRAQRVQNFSYGFLQAGIRPGDRMAVLAPNSYVRPFEFPQVPA